MLNHMTTIRHKTLADVIRPHTLYREADLSAALARMSGLPFFESALFSLASRLSKDYNGGSWKFVRVAETDEGRSLEHPAIFMYPDVEEGTVFHVVNADNYFEGDLDPITFGIGVTLMSLSAASFVDRTKRSATAFHALYDWLVKVEDYVDPQLYRLID